MHIEVINWVMKQKEEHPEWFEKRRVLEIGSLDMNGSIREAFDDCEYIGLDRRAGKGVDVVCYAHNYYSPTPFQTIISTGTLEHDRHAWLTMQAVYSLLEEKGVFICTCANVNFQRHDIECGEDYWYKNISIEEMKGWVNEFGFNLLCVEEDAKKRELFFVLERP